MTTTAIIGDLIIDKTEVG